MSQKGDVPLFQYRGAIAKPTEIDDDSDKDDTADLLAILSSKGKKTGGKKRALPKLTKKPSRSSSQSSSQEKSASQEIKKPKLTLDLADDDDLPILNNPEPPVRQSTVYRPRDLSDPKVLTLIHTESLLNQFRNSQPIESEPLSFDSDPLSASTSPKSTILVIKVRTNKNEHDISKFRIYSSDPFSKLERGYRDAKKLSDKDHVIFKLYGIVIDMHKTPADAEIADSDIIDAIVTKGISEKSLTSVLDIEDDEVPVKETNEPDTSNPVTEVDDYVSLKFRRDDKDIIKN